MSAVFLEAGKKVLEAFQYPIRIVKAKADEHAKGYYIRNKAQSIVEREVI